MTGGGKVLVVDDEHKIRELVAGYVEREGYAVTMAGSGEAPSPPPCASGRT